ncbi:Undecaprenyl-phosphate glucose phosphotransferase [Caloramator quimbayensis]|uniref:Undecaprenyl-phosphate glucose phosphotransferase n=1 Tax=Caloramator quimbayensis TaxID=1147123 RepID=A0A1T4WI57_9CLOT|nr:undecaprenyl-phosphate glucose phosphotransferase [Caloramator quimbayensis]SKA76585.1 Undecaprenyl-phosphate glucose phosphotransferase [Caloramator quimbayensis]
MIKQNQQHFNRLQVLLDVVCILASLFLSWFIRFKSGIVGVEGGYLSFDVYLKYGSAVIPAYLFFYNLYKLYLPKRTKTILSEYIDVFKANLLGLLIFIFVLYITKEINYSRVYLFIFGIINFIITILERSFVRLVLRNLRRRGKNLKHIVFVGLSDGAKDFINKININSHWGYNIVAIFDDELKRRLNENYIYKNELVAATKEYVEFYERKVDELYKNDAIYNYSELEKVLGCLNIDEVFITLDINEYNRMKKILDLCEKYGVRIQIIPAYYKYIPSKPYLEEINGIPVISARYIPLDLISNKIIKRLFDLICSFILIILFSPIMIIVAVIIKLTSPGPVIFKQERVGYNKKPFIMYKFRSMKVQSSEEERVKWTTKDDPRKTKFGEFIRKTSLDELPQFFNALKGDMSIVGPRPERPYFVDKFKEEIPQYMVKHQVKPGITGWAQVNGLRGDTSIKKRIEYDLYYIENWSLFFDIKIMFLTVFKGLVNKNAY